MLRQLEAPNALARCTRERASLVAHQLAFQQGRRYRGAVYGDEGGGGSITQVVNAARDALLTGASFALNQHGRVGTGHGLNVPQD